MAAMSNLNQTVFLTALLSGDILLVASFLVARLNWRPDLPLYNFRTRSVDVLLHHAKYVTPKALPVTRSLQVLGGLLLALAVAVIARKAFLDFAH